MPHRPGRTLAAAVHRPLAEQLVAEAALCGGERVLVLSAGDDELAARVAAVHPATAVDVVKVGDVPVAQALRRARGSADLALALFAVPPGPALGATLEAVGRAAGRARVLAWEDGATHETALRRAWMESCPGARPPVPAPVAAGPLPDGWSHAVLRDVARFDGIGQAGAALLTERGIEVPPPCAATLCERLAHHLAPFTAADGTMRVPVWASLLALR